MNVESGANSSGIFGDAVVVVVPVVDVVGAGTGVVAGLLVELDDTLRIATVDGGGGEVNDVGFGVVVVVVEVGDNCCGVVDVGGGEGGGAGLEARVVVVEGMAKVAAVEMVANSGVGEVDVEMLMAHNKLTKTIITL